MNIDVSSLLMFRLEFVYIYFLILGFKTAIKFQLIYAAYGLFNLSIIQFDALRSNKLVPHLTHSVNKGT